MSTIIVSVIALLLYLWYRHYSEFKDFPPGPPKWPLVGCLFSILGIHGSRLISETAKYVPKYGNIVGYSIGVLRY